MKKYRHVLLLLPTAVLSYLCFYYPNKITRLEQADKVMSEFTVNMQIREDFYNLNFDMDRKMTGLKAPDILCTGWRKNAGQLSELTKGRPVLIFKYSELNCSTCYEESIKELQDIFRDFPESARIICAYNIERDFIAFKKINIIKLDIYRISHDSFNWIAEEYNNPYYFVLHPDMKISNIYEHLRAKQILPGDEQSLS
jgi:hypothetical protein